MTVPEGIPSTQDLLAYAERQIAFLTGIANRQADKLCQIRNYRDELQASPYYPHDETTAYAVSVLTDILDSDS